MAIKDLIRQKKILIRVALLAVAPLWLHASLGCGSSTTVVVQSSAPTDGSDDGSQDGGDITISEPESTGDPAIHSKTQHIDLVFSGGSAVPVTYSQTRSGSVEVSSDLSF